jgi:glycosyltransferase involved in cell wall biosynthesis
VTTPLLVVGDGPQEPTGLGRIARDLCGHLAGSDLASQVELVQVGGPIPPVWSAWRHLPMGEAERGDDWGASYVQAIYRDLFGRRPGLLWVIWDPGRCAAYLDVDLPVQKWGYMAIDAPNRNGELSGPAAQAVAHFDRVIAYGRWASVIAKTVRAEAVPYLPHGLMLEVFDQEEAIEWAREQLGPYVGSRQIIGCLATNQPRKDLGLYCQTLAELRHRGHDVYGWLHTDVLVKAWSLPQLIEDCGLQKRVTVSTATYDDLQLAALYAICDVTIAPGLGEGFGYPICESLAAGVPVVHGDFGGGRELVPKKEWRFPVREVRLEGIYGQQRPVFRAEDVANAIERVWQWRAQVGELVEEEYCRGAVAYLDWKAIWPRWRSWIRQGL